MNIEVVYAASASPGEQLLFAIDVPVGCTVSEAIACIQSSESLTRLLDLAQIGEQALVELPMSVFGQRVNLNTVLQEGDRLEICRPLKVDPKQARRHRAESR